MKRKNSERLLKAIEVAGVLVSLYTVNPPVAIAITPLVIHCLISISRDEDKKEERKS